MRMRYLLIAGAAALALGLAGCGSSDDDDSTADAPTGTTPTTPTTPPAASPVAHTADVTLAADAIAALLQVLRVAGSSDTVKVAAGDYEKRGDPTKGGEVVFTCDSDYDCVFTVTNSLDKILVSVMTYKLPDADDPMVTAMIPLPMDPLNPRYTLNASNAASVQAIIDVAY